MKSSRVWIDHLRLRGYRSCISTSLKPNADLTVLIGPNGSGKTNILHGALLLALRGRRFGRTGTEGRPNRMFVQAGFRVDDVSVPYRAWVDYTTNDKNQDEVLAVREQWNFKGINRQDKWESFPSNEAFGRYYTRNRLVAHRTLTTARAFDDQYLFVPPRIRPYFAAITEYRARITYYSASQFTNPSLCPSSFEIDEDGDLRPMGSSRNEHLRVLYDLYRHSKQNPDGYREYLNLVGKGGIGLIDKLTWRQVRVSSSTVEVKSGGKVEKERRDRLLIIPNVYLNGSHLSFNQLSEGTFKTLALLFYLMTDASGLLLIEEPEVCVHHGLLASVVEIIKTFSQERQILCSTHSDFVLDALRPEQVRSVKNEKTRGTVVRSIAQSFSKKKLEALKEYLRTSGNLGEYWRHGGLDA